MEINATKSKIWLSLMRAFLLILLVSAWGCLSKNEERKSQENLGQKDTFYQYNIWWGFVNKVFDGALTVKELKTKGDVGLGSYTQLDGELVMLDGIPYRIREDGSVTVPADADKIEYVDAAFFEPDSSFQIAKAGNFDSLRSIINTHLPTVNQFYTFKIKGDFRYMKCGGLTRQEKPYSQGLDVLIPARPVFERENFTGTIIRFYCPEFIGNINVAGYHFHFISDDKKFGGHVVELQGQNLTVEIDPLLNYQFTLPGSKEFAKVSMEKEFQYKKN